ncbi:MAG: ABC transporter substrate-binding protein [Alphaproteobacteria bacterium]|nr:ABC transporter substrate-binding protein [Alphaproteobacteria bacterium]
MLQGTAAAGVLAASGAPAVAMPKRGGTLRIGLKGANTSDTWDGRTHSDTFMINMGHGCVFECLTEVMANGELTGELAESWSASADARVWTFKLRKGVTFHNGKSFGADDVIESLQMHTAEGAKSAAKPIVAAITEMKKLGEHEVRLTLESGNADFPYLLSDYHIMIYPAGMIDEAIAKGIGTGPYSVVSFDPGVRAVVKRVDDHHLSDRGGYFDGIEAIAINDDAARTNALLTGQVDAISDIDKKTIPLAKANPNVRILEVTGNMQYTFPMLVGVEPFGDINVRKALKYACNREEMVAKILQGHGAVGNDNPIGPANQYVNNDIEQLAYDPDKSKFYLKKAGMTSLNIDLSTSDGAFSGAVDAAQLYQNSAKAAGININVVQEPADGYWSNVWLKKGWCACYWSGRATEDWMFSTAYERGVPWNDTGWDDDRFQKLLLQGRAELDSGNRREIYGEMQKIISQDGATIIPMFANYIDAYSPKLAFSGEAGNLWKLDNSRICKRWWMA